MKKSKKKTEIQELSEFIRDRMVTKEYLDEKLEVKFDEKLAPLYKLLENHTLSLAEIREEVRDIRRCLGDLEKRIGNLKGYSKDIDYLYERLEIVEKHVGLKNAARG